jgi:hypothetical protein
MPAPARWPWRRRSRRARRRRHAPAGYRFTRATVTDRGQTPKARTSRPLCTVGRQVSVEAKSDLSVTFLDRLEGAVIPRRRARQTLARSLADALSRDRVMDIGIRPLWRDAASRRSRPTPSGVYPATTSCHAAIYRAAPGGVICRRGRRRRLRQCRWQRVRKIAQRRSVARFVVDGVIAMSPRARGAAPSRPGVCPHLRGQDRLGAPGRRCRASAGSSCIPGTAGGGPGGRRRRAGATAEAGHRQRGAGRRTRPRASTRGRSPPRGSRRRSARRLPASRSGHARRQGPEHPPRPSQCWAVRNGVSGSLPWNHHRGFGAIGCQPQSFSPGGSTIADRPSRQGCATSSGVNVPSGRDHHREPMGMEQGRRLHRRDLSLRDPPLLSPLGMPARSRQQRSRRPCGTRLLRHRSTKFAKAKRDTVPILDAFRTLLSVLKPSGSSVGRPTPYRVVTVEARAVAGTTAGTPRDSSSPGRPRPATSRPVPTLRPGLAFHSAPHLGLHAATSASGPLPGAR